MRGGGGGWGVSLTDVDLDSHIRDNIITRSQNTFLS